MSEPIVMTESDRNVDLDEMLAFSSADSKPKPILEGQSRLRHTWQVETWAGNLIAGECHLSESLGLWDGRFPVTLSGHNGLRFVRVAATEGASGMLIAVPASKESAALLSAKPTLSNGPVDDRNLMDVEPQNPAIQMLLDLLRAGETSEALILAPQIAIELLAPAEKKKDPVAAAISCYFLLDAIRRNDENRELWSVVLKAVKRLERYEDWLPDGAVLAAQVATLEERYADAAECMSRLETRGPPIVTWGLTKAIELLRIVMRRIGDTHHEYFALDRTLSRLVEIAVLADLSRSFLTFRDFDPAGPLCSGTTA